jgi:hypothetical protein
LSKNIVEEKTMWEICSIGRLKIMANGPTRDDLQDIVGQVGNLVSDALDPALSREEVIEKL